MVLCSQHKTKTSSGWMYVAENAASLSQQSLVVIVLAFYSRKGHNEKQRRTGKEEEGKRGKLGASQFTTFAAPAGSQPFLYIQMRRFANV